MNLSQLETGQRGVIVKVKGHGGFRKRIVEMGFVKGKHIEVLLNAPLMDPVKYQIMGYEVSLRREEARQIDVITEEEDLTNIPEINFFGTLTDKEAHDDGLHLKQTKLTRLVEECHNVINVALVGNPNCGKTSLFNIASGAHEHVGNYSGVTVDAKRGFLYYKNYRINLIDLPGTYSLSAYTPEELYVRRYIIKKTPDVVINVVDASNIERNLYLTTQLIDMNVRTVMALNMYDELQQSGNKLDYKQLGTLLGIPIEPTICKSGFGINELLDRVIAIYNDQEKVARHIHINHGRELERSISRVQRYIAKNESIRSRFSTRFLAIKLLENDDRINVRIQKLPNSEEITRVVDEEKTRLKKELHSDSESAITDAKYGFIDGALRETFKNEHLQKRRLTRIFDSVLTNRYFGFPIFFLFMFLMFQATFTLGNYPMDWITWLVDQLRNLVSQYMPLGPLKDMVVDGIIGGVGGVIVFLPNILILYFFIALMEDSGYMARAAFIMDKLMHKLGLHGKSFIPLVMGFGCNVPAIMSTRTIEDRKSRLITMLIVPFMSCSARLPIYIIFTAALFPNNGAMVLMSLYLIGIIIAVFAAKLFSKWLVKGESTPFVMELPPYRMPTNKALFRHTWQRGAQYLRKMGGVIMIASIVIWFLGYYPNHDGFSSHQEQQENSYLASMGKVIEPIIKPLGFDWKLGVGLISGAGAKEVVVSTLSVIYSQDGSEVNEQELGKRIPIDRITAYAYMLFCLVYFPCIATLVAIKNESGHWKWALLSAVYSTSLAWIIAFIFNQGGHLLM
ncbi:MAG: ferrous iron transport protein B [Bacteroidaceae bacterium]